MVIGILVVSSELMITNITVPMYVGIATIALALSYIAKIMVYDED